MSKQQKKRSHWNSRLGFILAAAGSAVGLGNIWKFPYITGENGGGLFVLIYLVCIALVGVPVMIAEVMLGRKSRTSSAGAFRGHLNGSNAGDRRTPWSIVGWMGVVTGFVLLSFYSIIAGWVLHYVVYAIRGLFTADAVAAQSLFKELAGSWQHSMLSHAIFMVVTVGIVVLGVSGGIEKATKVLMPTLFVLLGTLLVYAMTTPGFGDAASFVFAPNPDKLSGAGVLEALGHSFFTLSLGMGALLTYGSYLQKKDDIIATSVTISLLDTGVALGSCLIMFPILFSFGMDPGQGPGLVFVSMPLAFASMTGGYLLSIVFFVLLFFAALTSAISLLEVVVAAAIDQGKMTRKKATIVFGFAVFIYGSLSSGLDEKLLPFWKGWFGKNFLDSMDYLVSNWFLPLGGLFIALYAGWVLPKEQSQQEFAEGSRYAWLYEPWLLLIRYLVPAAITAILIYKLWPAT